MACNDTDKVQGTLSPTLWANEKQVKKATTPCNLTLRWAELKKERSEDGSTNHGKR